MFYVYILQSIRNKQFYIGHTNNLTRRLREHRSGGTTSLKGRGLYKLVYYEKLETRAEALLREKYLKSGSGREKRPGLVANFSPEFVRQGIHSVGL